MNTVAFHPTEKRPVPTLFLPSGEDRKRVYRLIDIEPLETKLLIQRVRGAEMSLDHLLSQLPLQIGITQRRQEVFKDIFGNQKVGLALFELEATLQSIHKQESQDYFHNPLAIVSYVDKLNLLAQAIEVVMERLRPTNPRSEGLQELVSYAEIISATDEYQAIKMLEGIIAKRRGVVDAVVKQQYASKADEEYSLKGSHTIVDVIQAFQEIFQGAMTQLDPQFQPPEGSLAAVDQLHRTAQEVVGAGSDPKSVSRVIFDLCHTVDFPWYMRFRENYGGLNPNQLGKVPFKPLGLLSSVNFYSHFTRVFSELAQSGYPIILPSIVPKEERRMEVTQGHDPVLALENLFRRKPERTVANDLQTTPEQNVAVVEAMNGAGKTSILKFVGNTQLCAQLGLPVLAREATISMVDDIMTYFGPQRGYEKTPDGEYAATLQQILEMIQGGYIYRAGYQVTGTPMPPLSPFSLLLFDQFGDGTDHTEAVRANLLLLRYVHEIGATAYFATHIHELAEAVEQRKFPGAFTLTYELTGRYPHLRSTHRLVRDARGESHGELVALRSGFDEDSLFGFLDQQVRRGVIPSEYTRRGRRS